MADSLEEALRLLNATNITERFNAARFFVGNKYPEYKLLLIERRNRERVRHVKMALNQAITGIDVIENEKFLDTTDYDNSTEKELRRYLKAQAIYEFSGTIIHELSKRIGLLEFNLQKEFSKLSGSSTEKSFKNLKAVFKGIENLQRSAETPKSTEFDLSQLSDYA